MMQAGIHIEPPPATGATAFWNVQYCCGLLLQARIWR